MSGLRKAALVMHGLGEQDRQWLLERLPAHRARELNALLEELGALGFPSDDELIREAAGTPSQSRAAVGPDSGPIARASVEQVHALLKDEPDALIALVISSGPGPWREALLLGFAPSRAKSIRELALSVNTGPQLRAAVLDELAGRLASLPMPAPTVRAEGRLTRWIRKPLRAAVEGRLDAWRR